MEVLRLLIGKSGKTQKEIAAELGVSQQRFNFYVTGKRQPDIELLIKIADYFGVSLDYLLGRTDNPYFEHSYEQNGKTVKVVTTEKEAPTPSERESFLEMIKPENELDITALELPAGLRTYIDTLVRSAVSEALRKNDKD